MKRWVVFGITFINGVLYLLLWAEMLTKAVVGHFSSQFSNDAACLNGVYFISC